MLSPSPSSHMARLERIKWPQHEAPRRLHMRLHGSVNIPEVTSFPQPDQPAQTSVISPTGSVDSGRPASYMRLPSHKYFLYGGPRFSISVLDSTSGAVDPTSIPVPLPVSASEVSCVDFSQWEVLSLAVVGESQVWVGTDESSLHVFDLSPSLRLSNHAYTKLEDPAICILARQLYDSSAASRPVQRIEVLLGSPDGNLTVVSGEANERGGLRTPLSKSPRQLVQLSGFNRTGNSVVKCVTAVNGFRAEEDEYWCGCGPNIVILRRSDWKVCCNFDAAAGETLPSGCELAESIHVGSLIASEVGVWSTLTQSSTMILWDYKTHAAKLKITACNYCTTDEGWVDDEAKITATSFAFPLLYAGTNGGHLLIFKLTEEPPSRSRTPVQASKPTLSYRLSAAVHCSSQPILSIHPTPMREELGTPFTPSPTAHVLVIHGQGEAGTSSLLQLYELSGSPRESPVISPLSGRSSVSSAISGSFSVRRVSSNGSLPPISLHAVSPKALSYLPLKSQV